ncbi:hypothetical protein AJ79_07314 [Helicocarpus griseus UAMH5409]|uniref:Uncharacterized protein n=1 Tax=Helicocarpus griseus UAMH5409 TaxID=1447875 RepID=A0A2B7X4F8_9EURO|nr:hypothetical protein AJ79_07314 [Helicocarpus griseus UAMH5409]
MEPVVFDDSMEVGSDAGHDHHANMDDIEIDVDLVHDRITEHGDDDVVVEDASATASDHPAGEEEATYDADMADGEYMDDEIPGPGYIGYQEGYYEFDDDSAYRNPDEYEAEMEEDYEEDIDAPIPDNDFGETNVSAVEEDEGKEGEVQAEVGQGEEREGGETEVSDHQPPIPQAPSKSEHVEVEDSGATLETEQEPLAQKYIGDDQQRRPEERSAGEGNEPAHVPEGHEEYANRTEPVLKDDDRQSQTGPEFEEPQVQESKQELAEKSYEPQFQEHDHSQSNQERQSDSSESYHFVQPQDYSEQDEAGNIGKSEALYPVKVLYQDNEISLFPPVESDPSETFFLQDEGLAYTPIGELVESCRQVLGEHISKDEELLVDIESLGLHLPEYSIGKTTTSLAQIVQVYLDLCSNDGISEPEPLYITLSSRSHFMSDFSRLVTAAREGKGLSYLAWEDYDLDKAEEYVEHEEGHEEEHEEEHVKPETIPEGTTPLAEPHSGYEKTSDQGEAAGDSTSKTLPPDSTSQSSFIEPTKQELPVQEEPEISGAAHENGQVPNADFQPEATGSGGAESPHEDGEYDGSQSDQGEEEDEEAEEVEVYDEDNVESEHRDESAETQASPRHSPAPPQTMKIPTVDFSRDESTDQQPETYVDEYGFSSAQTQLEGGPEEDVEDVEEFHEEAGEKYRHGDDVEPEEDLTESHTVSLNNGNGSDDHVQPSTNNDAHIEIDLGADDAVQRKELGIEHTGEALDEGEIYEPDEAVPGTEHEANAIPPGDGEQDTASLAVMPSAASRPKTPEPTHDVFEIDEDLFKSPMAETHETAPAIGSTRSSPLDEAEDGSVNGETGPTTKPNLDTDNLDATDEAITGDSSDHRRSEDKEVRGPNDLPAQGSPKSAKRSFIDAGINDAEGSTPDNKRHRPD